MQGKKLSQTDIILKLLESADGNKIVDDYSQCIERDNLRCQNSRCITRTEQEIRHLFRLTDEKNKVCRCIYCETKQNF